MKKTRPVLFADFRHLLSRLGFAVRETDSAWVFEHASEGVVVLRRYVDDEPVAPRDLASTRTFLDYRGMLAAADFDLQLSDASTPLDLRIEEPCAAG